jgi:DhnA family fructose-bisphosphate aldolase class Ia
LRNSASRADLFSQGEHSVEDAIALFELAVVIIIVFRVQSEVQEVVVVGRVVSIVSGPLFRVDSADGQGWTFT